MMKEVEHANAILNRVLFQSISFFDYDEKFYHGFLLGMFAGHPAISNQEAGLGRYDIAMLPLSFDERGLLLELKMSDSLANLKTIAKKACKQIEDKKYIEGLHAIGYEDILGYGVAFYKKSCMIMAIHNEL